MQWNPCEYCSHIHLVCSNPPPRSLLVWQSGGSRYQQTEGRGLPTSTIINMMELIATEEHFILLKIQQCEHALWISRTTGEFSIRASWDLARWIILYFWAVDIIMLILIGQEDFLESVGEFKVRIHPCSSFCLTQTKRSVTRQICKTKKNKILRKTMLVQLSNSDKNHSSSSETCSLFLDALASLNFKLSVTESYFFYS